MIDFEMTTIQVRRSTEQRLAKLAGLMGVSLVEAVDAAVDMLEEQRLLDGAVRSWEKYARQNGQRCSTAS